MPRSSSLASSGIPWRFGLLPSHVGSAENPARKVAIFTVHGIGDQRHAETSNAMRVGFERSAEDPAYDARCGVPYVHDGFWGNYDDFEASMPEVAALLGSEEREQLQALFRARSLSGLRTFLWFVGRLMAMVSPKTLFTVGPIRYITYVLMGLMSIAGMGFLLIRMPRVMATVVNDVRLYGSPEGATEHAICAGIDRRVIESFLRLFGVDASLNPLPTDKLVHLEGQPVVFDKVVWVSHSLGTVISYNCLVDVIELCRRAIEKGAEYGDGHEAALQGKNAHRVLSGLHRFITMGSPLQKATFLFAQCLREANRANALITWYEQKYVAGNGASKTAWWMNYFLVLDPVSGRLLDTKRFAPFVENIHPSRWGIPAVCHTAYWSDVLVTSPILSRALGREFFPYDWRKAKWSPARVSIVRVVAFFLVVTIPVVAYFFLR